MRIIITAKTKSHNPTEEELDKSVDVIMAIADKLKYEIKGCKCYKDGTSLVMER